MAPETASFALHVHADPVLPGKLRTGRATEPERPDMRRWLSPPEQGVRPEIQGLRAVAVMLVVVYHLWPDVLPGGYAGVDVFFVISGFLITAHLLREVEKTGRVRLTAFWARRARRLLPASLLVIVVAAIGTLVFVPITFWRDFFMQSAAAIVYVLNWLLAVDSVDYLGAENNASPVQHYWSLSVEEQFYLVWPLLILLAILFAGKRFSRRRAIAVVLGVTTVVSFGISVVMTIREPAMAYFVTPTRAWEFGVGGLLAFLPAIASMTLRAVLGWAGVGGIVITGFFYNASVPFPGYTALLPVLATAAVIWAGTTAQVWSPAHLSRLRPVHYLGNVSYSLYLWHWPLIVIAPYALGRPLNPLDPWILLAISVLLAGLTKRFVEDPGRSIRALTERKPRVSLIVTAAAMVIALVLPLAGWGIARAERISEQATTKAYLAGDEECVGAAALSDPSCGEGDGLGDLLLPGLASLKQDNGGAYACSNTETLQGTMRTCSYGSERDDALRVAINGDSHGAMLLPALLPLLEERNWRLDTYIGRGCTWTTADLDTQCAAYRVLLQDRFLEEKYDVIVTTAFRGRETTAQRADLVASARAEAWSPVIDGGTAVVAVADNPLVPDEMTDCVIEHPESALRGDACTIDKDQAYERPDSMATAVELEPRAHLVETDDLYCVLDSCPMVIGNTIVYRDQHHLTASYSRTIGPSLADRIEEAVGIG
ncbi:acyltransferase family protein [Microbacterium sp. P07]|uniref:acyltransferase family protein n=1 Tax=Microbacterium sp. P07 TaxID=3366952 RepID=UPI0037458783